MNDQSLYSIGNQVVNKVPIMASLDVCQLEIVVRPRIIWLCSRHLIGLSGTQINNGQYLYHLGCSSYTREAKESRGKHDASPHLILSCGQDDR